MWRKQATISVQDEFSGRSLPDGLEDSLPPQQLEELFLRTRSGVRRSAELYIQICIVMDRLVKRVEGVAADHGRVAMSLQSLSEVSADTYATDNDEVPRLNDGLLTMGKHLRTAQALMEDESKGWDAGVLEDLKRQRDALVAMRDMFERKERLDRDNIPQLERRIQNNETKLSNLRAKQEGLVKPGEIEKVVESIIKVRQNNRILIPLVWDPYANISLPHTGQGIHCQSAQPPRLRQGVRSRRAELLPSHPVPHHAVESGLGAGEGQVLRDARRQLETSAGLA